MVKRLCVVCVCVPNVFWLHNNSAIVHSRKLENPAVYQCALCNLYGVLCAQRMDFFHLIEKWKYFQTCAKISKKKVKMIFDSHKKSNESLQRKKSFNKRGDQSINIERNCMFPFYSHVAKHRYLKYNLIRLNRM